MACVGTSITRSRHTRNLSLSLAHGIHPGVYQGAGWLQSVLHILYYLRLRGRVEAGLRTSYRRYGRWQKSATARWWWITGIHLIPYCVRTTESLLHLIEAVHELERSSGSHRREAWNRVS